MSGSILRASCAAAALALTTNAAAQSAPVACGTDPPPAVMQSARQHFDAGRSLISGGAFDHAERELREALALYDSPNTHFWLGRALDGLGRTADAFAAFDHTIILAARCTAVERAAGRQDRYSETVRLATEQRERLRAQLSWLVVTVRTEEPTDTVALSLDGAALTGGERQRRIAVRAGAHEINVSAAGHRERRVRVEAVAGQEHPVEVSVEHAQPLCQRHPEHASCVRTVAPCVGAACGPRPAPTSNGMLVAGVTTLSVGAVAGATGLGLWLYAREEFAALTRMCGQAGCDNAGASLRARTDSAQTLETVGIIVGWSGLAIAAAGASMVVIDRTRRSRPSVAFAPTPNGLAIAGRF
jgi:hypothetical protein